MVEYAHKWVSVVTLSLSYVGCLFGSVTTFVPRGQFPREHLWRAPLPPRPLVTQGLDSLHVSPSFCHATCIKSVPSPFLLSSTYILASIWSVPVLTSHHTHLFKSHIVTYIREVYLYQRLCIHEPLKPHK